MGSRIQPEPLSQRTFQEFGEVIENVHSDVLPNENGPLPANTIRANQGSAIKHVDVTKMRNFYDACPSKTLAALKMNMFTCHPRSLQLQENPKERLKCAISAEEQLQRAEHGARHALLFDVSILERHPYTPQTFIPLGLGKDDPNTCYLVICAPTIAEEREKTPLHHNDSSRKDPGPPDLTRLRAFIAKGSQSVTYAAGTWHAPMVVLGLKPVDFVVIQYCNGVAEEDCQEIELGSMDKKSGVPGVCLNGPPDNAGQFHRAKL